jgi:hypothetical protein
MQHLTLMAWRDGPLRLGEPSSNDREQTSSNQAEIGQVGEIIEMQHLTRMAVTPSGVFDEHPILIAQGQRMADELCGAELFYPHVAAAHPKNSVPHLAATFPQLFSNPRISHPTRRTPYRIWQSQNDHRARAELRALRR